MNIYKAVARKYKTTPDEVETEMKKAIEAGMANPDPKIQAKWRELFPDGKTPTPEAFIAVVAKEVSKKW